MGVTILSGSTGGIGGKIICSVFGLIFAAFGCFFISMAWNGMLESKAMQHWVETPCTIVSSAMQDAGEDYKLVLSYSYTYNGQSYTTDRYSKEKQYTAESVGEIDQMTKDLHPGKQTNCQVNPDNPSDAVLHLPTVKGSIAAFGFILIFPAFGILFAVLPWLGRRKKDKSHPEAPTTKRSAKGFLILFGAIFMLIGLIALKPLFITPLQKTHAAKTWNSIPATVISSKIKSHDSEDGTTYSVYIAYRYEVGGEEFLGDRYTFMGGSSSGHAGKAEVVRQYPKGHQFTLFVNPVDPVDSVIQRDTSAELLFGLIPLIFFIVGIAIMISGFRYKQAKLDTKQAKEKIIILKGNSPASKAVGLVLFTLLWNGIVFLIFKSDAPILFHIAFGLAGLAMIAASIHAILALFNPRPIVEITPGNIRPGTSVAMRWRTGGNINRIQQLTVTLQCLRITTETSGSGKNRNTRTVKTPIFTKELLQTVSQREIAQGTLQFPIPNDEPSSEPSNDKGICWQLLFHGDIRRWPDLKQELPFTVYSTDQIL